jgi:membrane fusion protein, multidrug efflux system
MNNHRTLSSIGLIVAILVLSLNGCVKEERAAAQPRVAPPAPVLVAAVLLKDVPVQIRAIGTVEPLSTVTIKSRVSGELQKVHVTPGQDVKAGDLLFEIDPRPFETALHEAQARLDRDKAQASNAQIDADRMAGLLKTSVATREEADRAKFTYESAQATVRADEAAIENARLQLEYAKIRSPVDGRAGEIITHQGNIIRGDDTQLLTIRQVRPIYVTFSVPEQDLQDVRRYSQAGQPLVDAIVPPESQPSETGKLSFIDNQVDTETGTIRLKATFDNTDRRLWPGQFVQVILKLTVESNLTVIPTRAIQNSQQGTFVYVVKDDLTFEMRSVKVGRAIGDDSVIDGGLKAGEQVVTDGQLRMDPRIKGAKVQVNREATTAPATKAEMS